MLSVLRCILRSACRPAKLCTRHTVQRKQLKQMWSLSGQPLPRLFFYLQVVVEVAPLPAHRVAQVIGPVPYSMVALATQVKIDMCSFCSHCAETAATVAICMRGACAGIGQKWLQCARVKRVCRLGACNLLSTALGGESSELAAMGATVVNCQLAVLQLTWQGWCS